MKTKMRYEEPKIDWIIRAISEEEERCDPECVIDYVSCGFESYGFGGEVLVVGKVKDSEKIAKFINTFCRLLIKGEKFSPEGIHYIDDINGHTQFVFHIFEYKTSNHLIPHPKVKYQLIPQF